MDRPAVGERHVVAGSTRGAILWSRAVAALLAAASVLIGLAVLAGYALRVAALVRVYPSLPPMYPNVAVAGIMAGLAILAHVWLPEPTGRRVASVVGVVIIAAFAAHLFEGLLGLPPTLLNTALMPADPVVAPTTSVGNRPVIETCVAMMLLGAALYRTPRATARAPMGQMAAATAALIGLVALTGYLYGVDRVSLAGSSISTVGMAAHTAVVILFLAVSLVLSRPTIGWMSVIFASGSAGSLARRMLAVILVVPTLLTGLVASVSGSIFVDDRLAASVAAAAQVVVLALVVLSPLSKLTAFDIERRQALDEVERSREALNDQAPLISALQAELSYTGALDDPRLCFAYEAAPASGLLAGDWFDLISVDADRYRLAVVDVSGHGPAAAMFALRLKDNLSASLARDAPLATCLGELVPMFRGREIMATALLIEIDLGRRLLRWVNAGHPPALWLDRSTIHDLTRTGPLLGLNSGPWHESTQDLPGHSTLLAHTDGLTDARNDARELWGESRLRRLATEAGNLGADTLVQVIMNEAKRHARERFEDDATLIAIEIMI